MEPYLSNQPAWSAPTTPPTQPYIPQRSAQSGWPVAFGIVAIVFGGLGLMAYGFGAIGHLIMPKLAALTGEKPPGMLAVFEGMAEWRGWLIAVSLGAAVLAGFLLIGGIGLLGRRRWAATLLVAWAVAKILYVPPYTLVNYQAQKGQMAAMSAQMQEEFAKQQPQGVSPMSTAAFESAFKIGIVFSFIFGVAWGWALPIVILVWFARRRIRDEMATWGAQPATSAWSA